ncbi:hypothetical protein [Actinomadura geliboluensis]|uniref:Uncharacterized protein n=1 Tax=Actinomadura geliboluensis TaxID=882440 RepID=A0A5S4H9U1_9ACTN|nr:hypothetical protein [Actinomadura geliboluensis]TMR41521.1 hypothetical protein ETD96_05230 [Actinomadura geliboluensis]
MQPDNEEGRPGAGATSEDEQQGGGYVPARVTDLPEPWATVRTGWARAGDAMPRPGSLAFRALAEDDPVRLAAAEVERLGVANDLRRHGPTCARLLTESLSGGGA